VPDDINRFWIPLAQILPVFVLALVVEARAAFAKRLKQLEKASKKGTSLRLFAWMDGAADLSYVLTFLLAMVLLVGWFVVALGVLAFQTVTSEASIVSAFVSTVIGAVLTGLLPVLRLGSQLLGANAKHVKASGRKKR
jgi:hypothetical protein